MPAAILEKKSLKGKSWQTDGWNDGRSTIWALHRWANNPKYRTYYRYLSYTCVSHIILHC